MKNLLSDSKKDTEDGKASNLSMSTSSILDGIELTQSTLHDINNTNKFMLIAINRCLDYAKTADGLKLIPKYETCHLTECVQTALNCLSSVADKKKVHIANIPEVICSHVITDKQWLQENILCLLTNAVKFTPRGVVDIRIRLIGDHHKGANGTNSEPSSIRSGIIRKSFSFGSAVDSKSFLRIEVEDQGIGIVKDMQQKLFAPFSQAQKHAGGTGLGLYSLSKRIEAIGGECGVRDRLDSRQGSLFWFTVPYKPDEITSAMMKLDALDDMSEVWMANFPAHPHHPINQKQDIRHSPSVLGNKPSRAHQRSNAGSLLFTNITMSSIATQCLFEKGGETNTQQEVSTPRSLMILLVDDSIPILKMTSKLLERQGHVVVCAENGLEALHHLEENKHKFDVMITDLQMPVMDGLEVIRRVTASDSCHHKEIQKELVKSKHIPPVARISNPLTSEKTIDTRKVYIADDIKDEHNPSHLIAVTRKKRMWIIASCGLDDDETIEETLRAGADAYLSKPFSMQQFHQVMLKLEHEYLSSSSP